MALQVLTEGFDEPSIDAILMARPTRSPGLYTQVRTLAQPWVQQDSMLRSAQVQGKQAGCVLKSC